MDWFRRLPLQRKLMLMVTVTCSLALVVAGVAFVGYDRLVFQRTMLRELTILADVLGNNSTAVLSFDSPESRASAEDLLAALKAQPHIVTACLYDKGGRVFATYARADVNATVPARPERATHRFEPDRLVIFRPVTWNEKPLGMIYLESDLVERTNRHRLYTGVVLAILVTILVATTVFSIRFQKMISQPILSLAETARAVAERKDYSVRATKMSDDELGLLTTAFNDMLTQIQERDADLRKAHDLLEHRVEQRTAELRTANGALQAEIGERQRAEEAVKSKAAELERSNAELEQFAYVASHDLQEPLRMVSSYLQLLEHRFEGKLDSDAKEFMGYAVDGAARMRSLIRDLLEYSRVGRKGRPLVPVDCEAVLATVRHNLQTAINETKAHITSAGLPLVTGDATELTQLFQNLIGNAIKFHGVQPPTVHVEAERKDSLWEFSVRDNGIGIDPQFAERIFVIFQRLHTRESYAGTGIGLAVCRKIVERLGGRIWVESQPGQGAAFHFTLPGIEEEKPS